MRTAPHDVRERTRYTVGKALIAAAVLSLVLAGCGSDNNIGTPATSSAAIDCGGKDALTGEGSTAQQNAIALFNQAWNRFCPRKNVSYNPTGSGAGREQFVAGHVDFAGSDSPLTADQVEPATKRCNGNPAWHLPLVFGPVAVAYHLDGVNPLVVNADVLAKIFTGKITNWRDPEIVALNHGVTLPDTDIAPIYRSDSSGTTDNFQKYLGAAAPQSWTKGAGSEFQGGVGEGVQKSAGVVQAVQSTPGAIAYVEKGFADQASLTYAQIDDGGGAVALSDDAARNAIDDAKFAGAGNDLRLDLNSLYGTKEPGAYPLVLVTYEIVCSKGYDPGISTALKSFLTAAADYGQNGLSPAGYIPLPDRFKQRLVAAIGAIQ
ncbi:phosphate ABC transporter substrate-binding protein PstS [Mycobacterium sp. MFM001]|uniref:phosphate ABC transporter substrate-binding protein PstS n=1 Tax=Mycobacterium sp. MFM001 TaxID=2049453 RepID=UPI001EDE3143|nr:phosphate ABC transporter substrate-binding protein PstS [Mycobacterium sp. MFM001]